MIVRMALFQSQELEETLSQCGHVAPEFGWAPILIVRVFSAPDITISANNWDALTISPGIRLIHDFGVIEAPDQLHENICDILREQTESVLACCLLADKNDVGSMSYARAIASQVRRSGVTRIIGSFKLGDFDGAVPWEDDRAPFDALYFSNTEDGLFHVPRMLFPTDPVMGYDAADVFSVCINRQGIVARVWATEGHVEAYLRRIDAVNSGFTGFTLRLSCTETEGPRLRDFDGISSCLQHLPGADGVLAINDTFAPDDVFWAEIALWKRAP